MALFFTKKRLNKQNKQAHCLKQVRGEKRQEKNSKK